MTERIRQPGGSWLVFGIAALLFAEVRAFSGYWSSPRGWGWLDLLCPFFVGGGVIEQQLYVAASGEARSAARTKFFVASRDLATLLYAVPILSTKISWARGWATPVSIVQCVCLMLWVAWRVSSASKASAGPSGA